MLPVTMPIYQRTGDNAYAYMISALFYPDLGLFLSGLENIESASQPVTMLWIGALLRILSCVFRRPNDGHYLLLWRVADSNCSCCGQYLTQENGPFRNILATFSSRQWFFDSIILYGTLKFRNMTNTK